MPHTADTMGLIHKPGVGPNNRFGFKNTGNNKANEKAPPGREKQVKALKKKFGKSGAYALAWAQHNKHGKPQKEAAGVGIVTKQNATKDVPVGGQYMNVKKLKLDWKEFNENFADVSLVCQHEKRTLEKIIITSNEVYIGCRTRI